MVSSARISGIVWLEEVVDKIQRKHDVLPVEVEELLSGNPKFRWLEAGRIQGEDLYAAFGRTLAGRFLVVFFVYKATREVLVISARAMTDQERRRYGKK